MKKNSGFKSESTLATEDTMALDADIIGDEDDLTFGGAPAEEALPTGVSAVAEQVKDTAAQALGQVKDTASQALEQGQQVAGQAIDKAKDGVKSQLSNQKEKAVSTLGNFTDALMHTGEQLRQSGQGVFGGYAETLADRVDNVAGYLRENDIDELTAQVEDFARKQPALFIGGAFIAGIALARFLKSSKSSTGASGASYNSTLPTPASAGALTTTTGTGYNSSSRQDQFSDEALPDNSPLTAHGYVPGIGVSGGESSRLSETSSSVFSPGSSD